MEHRTLDDQQTAFVPAIGFPILGHDYAERVRRALEHRRDLFDSALAVFADQGQPVADAAGIIVTALQSGGRVLVAGNGGSAAEAQHFAGELVGRFLMDRRPYTAIALTADTSILTAVGNDYGFDQIFARQVHALGRSGDVLVAFSTSGTSPNMLLAAEAARNCSMRIIAVTGDLPSPLGRLSDVAVRCPSTHTPVTQELHMMVTHILCEIVEAEMTAFDEEIVS